MEKKPVVVGIAHVEENLAACKSLIDYYAEQGVKRIGVEREISVHIAIRAIRSFIETARKKNKLSTFFEQYLTFVIRDLESLKGRPEAEEIFFGGLKKYAEQKGLEVITLEGIFGHEYSVKLQLERINAIVDHPEYIEKLKTIRPCDFPAVVMHTAFEEDYTQVVLRSEQMARRIQQHEVDVSFVGAAHAIVISDKLQIPKKDLLLVRSEKILSGEEKNAWEHELKDYFSGKTKILRAQRILEKMERFVKNKMEKVGFPKHERPK